MLVLTIPFYSVCTLSRQVLAVQVVLLHSSRTEAEKKAIVSVRRTQTPSNRVIWILL